MQLNTLENSTVTDLTEAFNLAFSDYVVPLSLTEVAMTEKMKTENIVLSLSAGAFKEGKLIGFILHGYDMIDGIPTIYNGGTGVVPSERGQSITTSLYHFIIPKLLEQGIQHHVLEVISTNLPAINVYEKIGFTRARQLGVYKSSALKDAANTIVIKEEDFPATILSVFQCCQPSWQNNTASIWRNKEGHDFLVAYNKDEIVGCAVYVKATGRVKQLAVHSQHRRKGIGKALVSYMMQQKQSEALVFTNVDLGYMPAIAFLESLGFTRLLFQFEMKLETAI